MSLILPNVGLYSMLRDRNRPKRLDTLFKFPFAYRTYAQQYSLLPMQLLALCERWNSSAVQIILEPCWGCPQQSNHRPGVWVELV